MKILAIETSCDETAAAIVEKSEVNALVQVHAEAIASSVELHKKTGGIIPENAAREQVASIIPTINDVVSRAARILGPSTTSISPSVWIQQNIDAIAVTQGPGLIGSLLVGVETAKTLSLSLDIPLIPVNHLLGHIYANWITSSNENTPTFPLIALIVSGGHTEILYFKNHHDYEIIGGTRDDAAGECFDKCARKIGFPYPGGPKISERATEYEEKNLEHTTHQKFLPRPLLHDDSLDFSFSGLKAAFVREVDAVGDLQAKDEIFQQKIAYELETSITEILTKKISRAIDELHPKSLLLSGGVAANNRLRNALQNLTEEKDVSFFMPELRHCMDNAAMIGVAAFFHNKPLSTPTAVKADPRLSL